MQQKRKTGKWWDKDSQLGNKGNVPCCWESCFLFNLVSHCTWWIRECENFKPGERKKSEVVGGSHFRGPALEKKRRLRERAGSYYVQVFAFLVGERGWHKGSVCVHFLFLFSKPTPLGSSSCFVQRRAFCCPVTSLVSSCLDQPRGQTFLQDKAELAEYAHMARAHRNVPWEVFL